MPYRQPIDYAMLARKLGHVFTNNALLYDALTHPSLPLGKRGPKNVKASAYERLEFLGDRVLGLVVAHWLYEMFPEADEGDLAKRHAYLVNRDMLKQVALSIGLDDHLRLARGEDVHAARKNLAALSDAMEGVIGALYLDGGYAVAEAFIRKEWAPWLIGGHAPPADPKTALQEFAQGHGLPLPIYKILEHSGPSHAPKFVVEVSVKGHPVVRADGGAKREAEKKAASLLLEKISES
jgi:ribonuclease-3